MILSLELQREEARKVLEAEQEAKRKEAEAMEEMMKQVGYCGFNKLFKKADMTFFKSI